MTAGSARPLCLVLMLSNNASPNDPVSHEVNSRHHSRRTTRVVAASLALIWLGAGLTALVLAVLPRRWLLAFVGIGALWYGALWVQVARKGRRLTSKEARVPWRMKSPPDG